MALFNNKPDPCHVNKGERLADRHSGLELNIFLTTKKKPEQHIFSARIIKFFT
jgi:hypothetical protein